MEDIITQPLLKSSGTPYFKLLMKLNEAEEDLRRSKLEWVDLKKKYDNLEKEHEQDMEEFGEEVVTDLRIDLHGSDDNFQELLATLFNDDLRERMKRHYFSDNNKNVKKWLKEQKEKHSEHYDGGFHYNGTEDGIIDMVNYYYNKKFGKNTREYEKSMYNDGDEDEEEESEDEEEESEEEESEEEEEDTAEDILERLKEVNRMNEERKLEVAKEAPKGKLAPAKETPQTKSTRSEYYSEKTKKNVSKVNVEKLLEFWDKYDGSVGKRKKLMEAFANKFGKKVVRDILETKTDDFNPFEYN